MKVPKAFLSHKFQDKKMVKEINEFLKSCFVKTWLDEENLPGGSHLKTKIEEGVEESDYFLAFISEAYLESKWCVSEFISAQENNVHIIPIILEDRKKLIKKSPVDIESVLRDQIGLQYDEYNPQPTKDKIWKAIWESYPIRFDPLKIETISDTKIQVIHIDIDELDTNILSTWDFNIEDYVSYSDRDGRLLQQFPVAFSGALPNWLNGFLSIPLSNKRDVYFYNQSKEYICAYSTIQSNCTGKILKKTVAQHN